MLHVFILRYMQAHPQGTYPVMLGGAGVGLVALGASHLTNTAGEGRALQS